MVVGRNNLLDTMKQGAVLIVEDCSFVTAHLSRAIRSEFPQRRVYAARSISEAQLFAFEYEIDFFILDVELPDGNGIDFLCDLQTVNPMAKVIVVTSSVVEELKDRAEALGVIRFYEKPLDVKLICQEIKNWVVADGEVSIAEKKEEIESEEGDHSQFQAVLSSLKPIDIVQLKCLSKVSQVLQFQDDLGNFGKIYLQAGNLIHAEGDGKVGVDALAVIFGWKRGKITEMELEEPSARTIEGNWQMLLMEAVRQVDESKAAVSMV